jgi:predicted RNA-binding Zn ribbon-like protein
MSTYTPETATVPFDLCGGHPALDFVNSLDHRFDPAGSKERLTGYGDLLRFAAETELLDPPQSRALARAVGTAAATRALRAALELREALAAVLYAKAEQRVPAVAEIGMLERCLLQAERPRHLQWVTRQPGVHASLQWQWQRGQVKAAGFPVWLIALTASQLMLSDDLGHVRACEADSCRWLFLDTSKNHTRRWCNMKICGNRAKARRFQERRAE